MNMTDITDAQIKRLRELMERRDAANAAWSAAPYDPNARLQYHRCVGALANEAMGCLSALLDALESRATPAPDHIHISGKDMSSETLESLAVMIAAAQKQFGKPVPVAVDEAARALIAALDNSFWGNSMGGILAGRNRLLAALGNAAPGAVDEALKKAVQEMRQYWRYAARDRYSVAEMDRLIDAVCSLALGQGAKAGEVIPTPAEPPSDGSVYPGVGET